MRIIDQEILFAMRIIDQEILFAIGETCIHSTSCPGELLNDKNLGEEYKETRPLNIRIMI
jgi:hypothetical protein